MRDGGSLPARLRGLRLGAIHGLRVRHRTGTCSGPGPRRPRHPGVLRQRRQVPRAIRGHVVRLSVNWLRDYVDPDVPEEELAHRLSFSGSKVEEIHHPGRGITDVVVAEVLAIHEHPNADNLTLVDVERGDGGTQRIVCGARNFAVGDRVPLAVVGAELPEMKITERKIRGEISAGMLCSARELGVSKDHSGILVLPADATVGDDVVRVLGLDDTILELEITPNRPDLMSVVGLAREVAALFDLELRLPDAELDASEGVDGGVQVEIQDRDGCPRYLARYIEGVKLGPSPAHIARRLLAAGMRSISNIVDATNYVLLELGHPLHAFDAARVADHHVVVRRARTGERFVTLDGIEREMHPDDLMIADPTKALAIAGVMGGQDSEVADDTSAVILESAYFDHASVAYTSRRHLLRTEASARFERKMDPEAVPHAAARCAGLIAELAGGTVAEAEVDEHPKPLERPKITLRPARTDKILGVSIPADEQIRYLAALQLRPTREDERVVVVPPGYRRDLEREIDLVEEVARLAGLERVPATLPPGRKGGLEVEQVAERTIRRTLVGLGLQEAWTHSFMGPQDPDMLGLPEGHPARDMVLIANPTTEDKTGVRTTLLPNMLRSTARNFAHGASAVALFEIARVFESSGEPLPREGLVLAVVLAGDRRPKTWDEEQRPWDFFGARGVVDALLASLRVPPADFTPATGMPFHPTRAARMSLAGTDLGAIGELHPDVCARFEAPSGTTVAEIALGPVLASVPPRPRAGEVPRYPPIYIDIAVVVPEDVPAGHVLSFVRSTGSPEVTSVRLFDLYRGEQIAAGNKSLAYALELRDPDKTLTDEEAGAVRDRIVAELASRFGATLRA
ncbi:MAG: phenylalanine--tRNA ligase subunit beta [Actinobacteria bacterium]|nr:phenylalanine--tRNA ligase subunit beta [Actinomycetota bacterium]